MGIVRSFARSFIHSFVRADFSRSGLVLYFVVTSVDDTRVSGSFRSMRSLCSVMPGRLAKRNDVT